MSEQSDQYADEQATPDLDELQQHEPEAAVLDVDVKGPVQTHPLPARVAIMHVETVGTDTVQLAGRDLRRARALVWATAAATAAYHLGTRPDEVDTETAVRPLAVAGDGTAGAVQIIELWHCEPLYAKAETGTITLSYVLEYWAD